MTTFDDRFAARVREAFDAYEEPVDEQALARLQTALTTGVVGAAAAPAPDRPAAPRGGATSPRWRGLSVFALVLVAAGTYFAIADRGVTPGRLGGDETASATRLATPPGEALAPEQEPSTIAQSVPPRSPAPPPAGETTPSPRASSSRAATPPLGPEAATATSTSPIPAPEVVPDVPPPFAGTETFAALTPAPPVALEPGEVRTVEPVALAPLRLGALAPAPTPEGVRLVLASGAVGSTEGLAEGVGVSAGVSREWAVTRSVAVSGGALLAYGRSFPEADAVNVSDVFSDLEDAPGRTAEVPDRSVLTTVAVEVPVDVTLDVLRTPRGRLRASVGLTSALYLDQRFEDEGTRYESETVVGVSGDRAVALSSEPYALEESVGVLGRLDLGRQLNLGLGVVGAGPDAIGLDLYVRLPLGGVTSRDLPLTITGVRLRVPLR